MVMHAHTHTQIVRCEWYTQRSGGCGWAGPAPLDAEGGDQHVEGDCRVPWERGAMVEQRFAQAEGSLMF